MLDDTVPGLFRRSLLWCRAGDAHSLASINFDGGDGLSSQKAPPTWSWMAFKGAIGYLELPFNQVEWETEDVISPWAEANLGTWTYSGDHSVKSRGLRVIARGFDTTAVVSDGYTKFILDRPTAVCRHSSALRRVIVGRLKEELDVNRGDARHFVLFLKPSNPEARDAQAYVRIGVGYMSGCLIDLDGKGLTSRVF